jgi:sortase A
VSPRRSTPTDDPSGPWRSGDRPPRRRSRWRDWRTYVGGLGRVLIATGLLILGFVAYQLWGTGIQEARSQNALESEFEAHLASTSTSAPTSSVAPTSSSPPPSVSTTPAVTSPPAPTLPQPTAPGATTVAPAPTTTPPTTPPPTDAGPATTVTPADGSTRPAYQDGDAVAHLEIPAIKLDKIVVMGVQLTDLKKGPGSYPTTPLPGEIGNAGIAGHRTTYGAPFERLDKLRPGDEIITTSYAGRFVYRVTDTKVVKPADTSVLAPSHEVRLTLTTCHPRYSTAQRLIVSAVLDPAASAQPVPPPTVPPPTTPPPGTTGPGATVTTDDGGGQTVSTTVAGATSTQPPETLAPPGTDPGAAQAVDELSRGWFSEPDAWPQVVLWGLALTAVSLVAWSIGRRTKHRWVGYLVGIVPFVILLYFFYENVARLLPPNL